MESKRMNIQQHTGFYIAGLTARTNNAHEMSGKGKIGNVWQQFLQPNLVAKIPLFTPTTRPTTPGITPIFWESPSSLRKNCRQTLPSNTFRQAATLSSPPTGGR